MPRIFRLAVIAAALLVPGAASALCVDVGKPVPDVTLPSIDGQNVSLNSFKGKIVLLAFWASWCPRCEEELTFLQNRSSGSSQARGLDRPHGSCRSFGHGSRA